MAHACNHAHSRDTATVSVPSRPGTPTTPMDILWGEHRVIVQILDVLDALRTRVATTGCIDGVPGADARMILDLLRTFADRCHHGKEEDILFPALEAASGGTFQPAEVMRGEHVQGRGHIADMAASVEGGDAHGFAVAAQDYVALMRVHIEKEDHCLFPFAAELLDAERCASLVDDFHRVEHEDLGSGVHERMLGQANDLAVRYCVARATDDPRVLSLVTAHCGCPITIGDDLPDPGDDITRIQPKADRVALVHRLHDHRVGGVAKVLAQLGEHWAVWRQDPRAGDRLTMQDRLRGDCRRLRALTDDFTCFADACRTAVDLYGELRTVVSQIEQHLDEDEKVTLAELAGMA